MILESNIVQGDMEFADWLDEVMAYIDTPDVGMSLPSDIQGTAFQRRVWEALNLLNVKRIDHGVQCLKDEKLVEKLSKSQIPLTVCPLSNVKLRVFNKLEDHNLKKMLDKKLMVMVNSDDPAYFGGYLNKNLIETQAALNLSKDEVKTLLVNSFKSSFLNEDKKKEWISKI